MDKDYDPAHSINISIVISDNGSVQNKDGSDVDELNDPHSKIDKMQRKRDFFVNQYVYDARLLKQRDLKSIYNSILNILKYKRYIDPLQNNSRHATYNQLKSEYTLQENSQISMENAMVHKLSESRLNQIIDECLYMILNEG